MHKFQGFDRTRFYARLLAAGSARFAPVGCVRTQVALGRFLFRGVPDGSMRPLRAGVDASFAADTLRLVDHSYIAVGFIHVTGACGAVLDTERRNALAAHGHDNVVGVFRERGSVSNDLYSGQ